MDKAKAREKRFAENVEAKKQYDAKRRKNKHLLQVLDKDNTTELEESRQDIDSLFFKF